MTGDKILYAVDGDHLLRGWAAPGVDYKSSMRRIPIVMFYALCKGMVDSVSSKVSAKYLFRC